MPIKWFTCPDGGRIEYKECLAAGGCRLKRRCAVRPYLRMVSTERVWTGKPSTTQLIRGTMGAFLQLTTQYAISPDDRAFMVHGTRAHQILQGFGDDEGSILEGVLDGDEVQETGIFDLLDFEGGKTVLTDHKTSGSYKVAKALGITTVDEETDVVYKSGPRKGQKRTRRMLKQDDGEVDVRDWSLQLNKYRIEIEKAAHQIDELYIQCIVRDGNTHIARSRGVMRNLYYFEIPKLPDEEVLAYFKRKREALTKALKDGRWANPCTEEENWGGIRCTRYCEVAEHCPLGKYLRQEKEIQSVPIKNLSETRWLDKLGNLRLGEKTKNAKGKEHPKEIDYFKIDPLTEVPEERESIIAQYEELFGKNPKSIDIVLPVGDPEIVFPQWWKRYGTALLQCKGDGEKATCSGQEYTKDLEVVGQDERGLPTVKCAGEECPYAKAKKCSRTATLQVLLPDLPGAGVWHITTGSVYSIININSKLDFLAGMLGQFHMIRLKLERRQKLTQHTGPDGKVQKGTHWPLHLNTQVALAEVQAIGKINKSLAMGTRAPLQLPPTTDIPDDKPDDIEVGEPGKAPPVPTEYKGLANLLSSKGGVPQAEFLVWVKERWEGQKSAYNAMLPALESDGVFNGIIGEFGKWMDRRNDDAADKEPTQGTLGT